MLLVTRTRLGRKTFVGGRERRRKECVSEATRGRRLERK